MDSSLNIFSLKSVTMQHRYNTHWGVSFLLKVSIKASQIGWTVVPRNKDCGFNPQSGHVQDSTNKWVEQQINVSLSFPFSPLHTSPPSLPLLLPFLSPFLPLSLSLPSPHSLKSINTKIKFKKDVLQYQTPKSNIHSVHCQPQEARCSRCSWWETSKSPPKYKIAEHSNQAKAILTKHRSQLYKLYQAFHFYTHQNRL